MKIKKQNLISYKMNLQNLLIIVIFVIGCFILYRMISSVQKQLFKLKNDVMNMKLSNESSNNMNNVDVIPDSSAPEEIDDSMSINSNDIDNIMNKLNSDETSVYGQDVIESSASEDSMTYPDVQLPAFEDQVNEDDPPVIKYESIYKNKQNKEKIKLVKLDDEEEVIVLDNESVESLEKEITEKEVIEFESESESENIEKKNTADANIIELSGASDESTSSKDSKTLTIDVAQETYDEYILHKKSLSELKTILKSKNLPIKGNKSELIRKILNTQNKM